MLPSDKLFLMVATNPASPATPRISASCPSTTNARISTATPSYPKTRVRAFEVPADPFALAEGWLTPTRRPACSSPSRPAASGSRYRARWYDPEIGRFLSRDAVEGALSQPLTQNRYTYVTNSPVKFTDPFGLWKTDPSCCDLKPGPEINEACGKLKECGDKGNYAASEMAGKCFDGKNQYTIHCRQDRVCRAFYEDGPGAHSLDPNRLTQCPNCMTLCVGDPPGPVPNIPKKVCHELFHSVAGALKGAHSAATQLCADCDIK